MTAIGVGVGLGFGAALAPDLRDILGSNLLGLWDAERADLLNLSGSLVTSWADAIGGYSAAQTISGSKPGYSPTSFNGRPGLTFDGTDDALTMPSQPFPTAPPGFEIWCLVDQQRLPASTGSNAIVGLGGATTADSVRIRRDVLNNQNITRSLIGTGASGQSVQHLGDFSGRHVVRARYGSTARISLDGLGEVTSNDAIALGSTRLRIGARSTDTNPATEFFQGVMSAILITLPLADAAADRTLANLKQRGGIA